MGHAIVEVLRKHFDITAEGLTALYDIRVRKLQKLIFAANGIRTTKDCERDLDWYRQRKRPGCTWPWRNLREALREW